MNFAVQCFDLTKRYASAPALRDLNLTVSAGEILALVGPSGCGKTTLLRLIAGFEQPDAGAIHLNGEPVAGRGFLFPPEQRRVGMVFQDYALFPHLSVWKNVTFGLNGRGKKEGEAEAARLLQVTGLAGYEDRYPHELSGGERQRVALARALAPQPVVVLLDEPFSSLDADRRGQMRAEVRSVLKDSGATAIFVTHDQEEALYMGDRLAVLNRGCLEQVDPPEQVFHYPRTRFVAEFMGQTDFVAGEVTPEGIRTELGCLPQITALPAGAQVEVAVRPDDLKIAVGGVPNAVVESSFFRGSDHLYRLRLRSGQTVHAVQPHTRVLQVGTRVRAWLEAGHPLACFEAEKAVKLLREPGSGAAACFAEQ